MSPAPASPTLLGIYARLSALALFSTMDALVKWLGDSYGPFQMMLFRSTIALVPLYFLFRNSGGIRLVRSSRPLLQAIRIVTGFGSLLGFFYVFPRMPLVDAYAISYAAPLFMVGLAAPILGEVVGWRRWSAVAVGFVGAYTTFSTFEYETMRLMQQGEMMLAMANVFGSLLAGVVAVFAGFALGSSI